MTDKHSGADASAEVDASNAASQTAASQASQADNTTGAQQARTTGFEGSWKQATDVNSEEAISSYNQFAVNRALRHQEDMDQLSKQLLQSGVAAISRMMQNAVTDDNMVNKQAIRHSDLAINGQWNEEEPQSTLRTREVADSGDE